MIVPIRCGETRSGIGSVLSGRTVFIQISPFREAMPPHDGACVGRSAEPASSTAPRTHRNRRAPDLGGGGINPGITGGQLLRRPSAVRFHCDTLSAIMRVDFIAAWLSWA